jgi:hypothetical protein
MTQLLTERVTAAQAEICDLAGVSPSGVAGELIGEIIQGCVEAELEAALAEAQ